MQITIGKMQVGSSRMVLLSQDELAAFYRFKSVFPELSIMLEANVFDFKGGQAFIHRDDNGVLRMIEVKGITYKAPHR